MVIRKLIDRFVLSIPMMSLIGVSISQWLILPNTGFYLMFDKVVLFYWLIYRPDRISIFWVTLLYLVPDLKEGLALGFSPLTTLLFAWFVLLQRHVLLRQSFLFQWFVFGVLVGIYLLFLFVTHGFLGASSLAMMPLMASAALGFSSYPVLARLLSKLQRLVPLHAALED